jgi:hypothetical protein
MEEENRGAPLPGFSSVFSQQNCNVKFESGRLLPDDKPVCGVTAVGSCWVD